MKEWIDIIENFVAHSAKHGYSPQEFYGICENS